MAVVAGDVADLLQCQHIWGFGQLFAQAAAQLFAAWPGQVQAADHGIFGRLVGGGPAGGRRVAGLAKIGAGTWQHGPVCAMLFDSRPPLYGSSLGGYSRCTIGQLDSMNYRGNRHPPFRTCLT